MRPEGAPHQTSFARKSPGDGDLPACCNGRVPRSQETEADRELIEYARGFGFRVTARMLEDWRRAGAMPPRERVDLGHYGTRYEDPPEAKERLIDVCRFLHKHEPFGERPDLPRRRRVAEAALWLWYGGSPIAAEIIRDVTAACYIAVAERLEARRRDAAAADPEAADFELPIIAADAEVENLLDSDLFRRQLRVFRRLGDELDDDPDGRARRATSQLIQALQGRAKPEPGALAGSVEAPLILSGVIDQPLADPEGERSLAERLSARHIIDTLADLSEDDWRDIREILHALNATLGSFEGSGEPQKQAFARLVPRTNTATRLVSAIGALAVHLDELREAVG